MIITVILAIILGLGGLIYIVQLGEATPAIIEIIITPFTLTVTKLFQLLGALAPLLIAIIPIYLALNNKNNIKERNKLVIFSAVYGLALYGIIILTGLDTKLIQAMRGSIFLGSTLNLALSIFGSLASWLTGLFTGLLLWGAGFALVLIDAALDALAGIGDAAKQSKHGIKQTQQSILNRIRGNN